MYQPTDNVRHLVTAITVHNAHMYKSFFPPRQSNTLPTNAKVGRKKPTIRKKTRFIHDLAENYRGQNVLFSNAQIHETLSSLSYSCNRAHSTPIPTTSQQSVAYVTPSLCQLLHNVRNERRGYSSSRSLGLGHIRHGHHRTDTASSRMKPNATLN